MDKLDYTQELFSNFFQNKVLYYAVADGDVVICEDKELFRKLVNYYGEKGADVKIGNLLEDGIASFSHNKELHDDLVHAVSMSQNLYGHGNANFSSEAYSLSLSANTKTFVASNNAEHIKAAVSIALDRYNTVAGKSFSRAETSLVSGTMKFNASINNKKLPEVAVYSDAEAYVKEARILNMIDAAMQEDSSEM